MIVPARVSRLSLPLLSVDSPGLTDRRQRIGTDRRPRPAPDTLGIRRGTRCERRAMPKSTILTKSLVPSWSTRKMFSGLRSMDDALVVHGLQAGGDLQGDATGPQRVDRSVGDHAA